MRAVAILSILLVTGCDASTKVASTRRGIFGGFERERNEPSVGCVAREVNRGRLTYRCCTGTLIAPDVVITAKHCMDDHRMRRVAFILGSTFVADSPVEFEAVLNEPGSHLVKSFVLHPRAQPIYFDTAVLFLEQPVDDPSVAWFPSQAEISILRPGAVGLRVGYGWTVDRLASDQAFPELDPISLRQATELVVSEVSPASFETEDTIDAGTCPGDSGGPVFLPAADGQPRLFGTHYGGYALEGCSDIGVEVRTDSVLAFVAREMARACDQGLRSRNACDLQRTPLTPKLSPPPALPSGKDVPDLESERIDVGDGPLMDEGGCTCTRPTLSPWGLWLLLALATPAMLQRRTP